jgi:SHS2 domain-containing protein
MMEKYKTIDHEADIGLEVNGKTLEELFKNAASGLFSLLVDLQNVKPEVGKKLEITGNGELLINFLNELLYLWDTEGFIPKEFSLRIENDRLTGNAIGGLFDPLRHTIKKEIKAVTYHEFSLTREKGICKARFILDV